MVPLKGGVLVSKSQSSGFTSSDGSFCALSSEFSQPAKSKRAIQAMRLHRITSARYNLLSA